MNVKRKKYNDKTKILIGLKKTCLGCFRIEEIRDKDNETGLKEGEGIEMSTIVAFHIRDASLSLRFKILTHIRFTFFRHSFYNKFVPS